MRNWRPFIADAMRDIEATGARRIVGIPLAPQFSTLSVQKYMDAAQAALPAGADFSCVRSFHDHPLLIDAFAESAGRAPGRDEDIVFTAHSLPQRVAAAGDPYPDEVAATAKAVADGAASASYHTAYQSAGRTPEPWLGPDLSDYVRARASPARAASWSCRSASCATTRRSCSTSTCRPPRPRARRASPCGARIAEHLADLHPGARRTGGAVAVVSRQSQSPVDEADYD